VARPHAAQHEWSVLALVVLGIARARRDGWHAGHGARHRHGRFCGTACHSMQWVAKEHVASGHHANRTGVKAGCHDCHLPRGYPMILWDKAKAGTKDIIGEMRGVIATEALFKKERARMAQHVWDEYKENKSQACRNCHMFSKEVLEKQKEFVRPMHQSVLDGQATCIDCHKGIAHTAPE
jgi:nitrate/TMAO reductase-like tetraheme cytochrome c subunit